MGMYIVVFNPLKMLFQIVTYAKALNLDYIRKKKKGSQVLRSFSKLAAFLQLFIIFLPYHI